MVSSDGISTTPTRQAKYGRKNNVNIINDGAEMKQVAEQWQG